jgi:hypothetical protein
VGTTLPHAPVKVSAGTAAIVPVEIAGLPAELDALGRRWQRKVEFHMTVVGRAVIERVGHGDPEAWERVARVVAGRSVGPIEVTRELRHVRHPDEPDFETIVVMVECPELAGVHRDLSAELGVELSPPPAHVTLYSTDPERGIGINDEAQLRERAPELSAQEQEELQRSMRFDEVFGAPAQR